MSDFNEINQKIANLQEIVSKQSKLIATTGQKLIEVQVQDVKTRMANFDKNQQQHQQQQQPSEDFINSEDVVQLVTELQTQLDGLEDRSMRRTYNAAITSDDEKLAPMTNKDGDFPDFKLPTTFKEFKELKKLDIINLGLFYEILLPNEEEINQTESRQDIDKINSQKSEKLEDFSKGFTESQVDEIFDELARFFGLRNRRGIDGY
ncbi:unnamed protein product [Candida verbasci]|uniref:Mrp8p n=1 Tax=Candida verbasci TaxID=1227364 RepID=A0A9W4TXS6_9ASCO|nr:unnamed protein product [Candida verbasci]